MKKVGKFLLRGFINIIQIPLTIVYFVFTFLGGLISGAIVWAPGFITEFVGEGIMFLKRALNELAI